MGCHFAYHLIDKNQAFDCRAIFDQIVMVAADIPSLNLRYLVAENRVSDRVGGSHVRLLFDPSDVTLSIAAEFHSAPRAGSTQDFAKQPWFHVIDTTRHDSRCL